MKKVLNSTKAPAPIGPYSVAINYGNIIYTSGQIGMDKEGKIVCDDVKGQTRMIIENLKSILDENGSTIGDTIGNKKGYAKFTMDIEQRNKLYVAKDLGSISFDIYCTEIQTKARENFVIPPQYTQSVNPVIPAVPTVVTPNTTVDKEK